MNILISHVFGAWNKGDWILLQEIIRLIKDSFPNAEISGISRDPELQERIFKDVTWYQRLDTSFHKRKLFRMIQVTVGILNILSLSTFYSTLKCLNITPPSFLGLREIYDADLIVMCPGGYWDSTKKSFISNLINLQALIFCQKYNRIIWAPQSIEKIDNQLLEWKFKELLNHASIAFLRESFSFKYVQSLNLTEVICQLTPDLAFYYQPDLNSLDDSIINKYLSKPEDKFVACTALEWHFPNSNDLKKSHKNYVEALAQSSIYMAEKYDIKTLLVRQIGDSEDGKGDIKVLYEIQKLSEGNAIVVEEDLTPDELSSLISKAEYLIGSRMHSNIFALLSGTPVIAVSYQKKTDGIMKMMELEDYLISIDDVSMRDIKYIAETILENRNQLSEYVKGKVDNLKKEREQIIEKFREICSI
ncbi:MAG: polysaccharide pyruvyl transferase family protein [Cyanobacteria bacterium J06649_11]